MLFVISSFYITKPFVLATNALPNMMLTAESRIQNRGSHIKHESHHKLVEHIDLMGAFAFPNNNFSYLELHGLIYDL